MATTEHTINDALAAVLRSTRRAWASSGDIVSSENTGMLKGSASDLTFWLSRRTYPLSS